jgi:hypothetical protein
MGIAGAYIHIEYRVYHFPTDDGLSAFQQRPGRVGSETIVARLLEFQAWKRDASGPVLHS